MRHTVIESERLVVYLTVSDENFIRLEARPLCQLKLNRFVRKFVEYQDAFDYDQYYDSLTCDERTSVDIDRLKTFIERYRVITSDSKNISHTVKELANLEIDLLQARLVEDDFVVAELSFDASKNDSFAILVKTIFRYYGMTVRGLLVCDALYLVEKAFRYVDLWSKDKTVISKHKESYYGRYFRK